MSQACPLLLGLSFYLILLEMLMICWLNCLKITTENSLYMEVERLSKEKIIPA